MKIDFLDVLKKLNLDISKYEKIEPQFEKIVFYQERLCVELNISTSDEFLEKEEFENSINEYLSDYKISINYSLRKTDDILDLIKNEILDYNPSSKVWIDQTEIKIVENLLELKLPNKGICFAVEQNGLTEHLLCKFTKIKSVQYSYLSEAPLTDLKSFMNDCRKEEEELEKTVVKQTLKTEKPAGENSIDFKYGKRDLVDIISISQIDQASGKVSLEAEVFDTELIVTKSQKYIFKIYVTDFTGSISCVIFLKDLNEPILNSLKIGDTVLLTGRVSFDNYSKQENILLKYLEKTKSKIPMDISNKKRVELKIHTKYSSLKGINSITEFAKRASIWGHTAIGLTDISDVQSFPEAMEASKKYGIKIIYGLNANYVPDDDILRFLDKDEKLSKKTYVVFDIETTGLSCRSDAIIEIGAVKVKDGNIIERFQTFVNPKRRIPPKIVELTSISDEDVKDADTIDIAIAKFYEFINGSVLVAHNAEFDISFIRKAILENALEFNFPIIDTLMLARALLVDQKSYKLEKICKRLNISLINAHRADEDAMATAQMFIKLLELAQRQGIDSLSELNTLKSNIDLNKIFEKPITIFVKTQEGLKNLYKLVSDSHIEYISNIAKTPRALIEKHRKGLLIGSGGIGSELFNKVFRNEPLEELKKIASFYDFLEIHSAENAAYSILDGQFTKNDIEEVDLKIYELGKILNIPVVAASDTYYLDSKDDILRRTAMGGKPIMPYREAVHEQDLSFKTTEKILQEFSFLGDAADEVVIENSNLIADLTEDVSPLAKGTFPPIIEGAADDLKDMSLKKAKSIYGEVLPEIIQKRLDKELNSIIGNGYSTLYMIAQKIVKKSNDDGYLVGSRGSVGSSFVATMLGITEVNPLPAHYVCPKCCYTEFPEDADVGVDMPDKNCPNCGNSLNRDGFNIPFEIFLGFNGDKEPDIDLNFSGEYQARAHQYTEELFGKNYVFRAGTIGTIAEKTAYEYTDRFFKNKFITPAEKRRIAKSIIGIKRTSGQHPGGVMIVPKNKEIYDFCPIQYASDDKSKEILTTHFDYHSIHSNILKLDLLGHDGPTMIKMLEDYSNFSASLIELNDKRTMTLFNSSDELNIDREIFDPATGTMGIPEFGTGFVIEMLKETLPKSFFELIRISGLSHGTMVWNDNARDIVLSKTATLSEVISTREDIMLNLIDAGCKEKFSFDVMERIRKGKGLLPEQKEQMMGLSLPKWYIKSCEKISYLFPKAHAVAYVMFSFRIAYYKLNYAAAFYASFFNLKLSNFDGITILKGPVEIKAKIKEMNDRAKIENKVLSKNDKDTIYIYNMALEMYARSLSFLPCDLYKSHYNRFSIEENKLRMPMSALPGISEAAALCIYREAKEKDFMSVEDLIKRTKITKTIVATLRENSILDKLVETNQINLFDLI